ncbi:hypothetical protein [Robiginitalea aurantiaca]|uniref:Uncharacterized protein n=1 Tax=Robiginitalea aurantiaca TaxID=3056915 RepID=A0ABT7WFK7_9FLAO|nr:hypothetical protein [Robiginitalea aurantiaca]MDM9631707.1 hypothetical protein [Robiginitalea aurantiaca]
MKNVIKIILMLLLATCQNEGQKSNNDLVSKEISNIEEHTSTNNLERITTLAFDPAINDVYKRNMNSEEKARFSFGQDVGILFFDVWYPPISYPGHHVNLKTYDFPVNLKFVPNYQGPEGFSGGPDGWGGWNLPSWVQAAKELEQEGVKAIVGGCGLTGNIQKDLQDAVNIPVYSSTMVFVPELYGDLPEGQKVGVLTVSSRVLRAYDDQLYKQLGITDDMLIVQGMTESPDGADFMKIVGDEYDPKIVERSLVKVAAQFVKDNPEVGKIILECTDMCQYKSAVEEVTGLEVFDAVDMTKLAFERHGSR